MHNLHANELDAIISSFTIEWLEVVIVPLRNWPVLCNYPVSSMNLSDMVCMQVCLGSEKLDLISIHYYINLMEHGIHGNTYDFELDQIALHL